MRWAPLPDECYEGVGAQWDVYRRMRGVVEECAPSSPSAPSASSKPAPASTKRRARRPRRTTKVVQYALSSDDDNSDDSDFDPGSTPPSSVDGRVEHSPWTRFVPATNVLWLQYLAAYLLKHGRRPCGRRPTAGPKLAARARQDAACAMLGDVAGTLGEDGMFDSARDVRAWGVECGWIR